MNTFGNTLRLTTFGESHGPAMGGIIDGLPPREVIDLARVRLELERRAPGRSTLASQRREPDSVEFLSGLMAYDEASGEISALAPDTVTAITLGTPVAFMIRNTDSRSRDYSQLHHTFRPNHADYAWQQRYGIRDWRGGGRSSGRETVSRVAAGAIARQILEKKHITIDATIQSIGGVEHPTEAQIDETITSAKSAGDSVGGVALLTIEGVPAGIGNPVFGKLDAMLASAMMSVGAVKGVEVGMGFAGCSKRGSEVADNFIDGPIERPEFASNHSGGIQGGMSNSAPIVMRIAVKSTPSVSVPLSGLTDTGEVVPLNITGRHDPCILPRVLPVVESMAALTVLDVWLSGIQQTAWNR